jgi:hypothetical protein
MSKKQPSITWRDNGSPVIHFNGKTSDPVSYQGIARLGDYYATSQYYAGVLPCLFKVEVLEEHEKVHV